MSLKNHLIIVFIIICAVFVSWQVMRPKPIVLPPMTAEEMEIAGRAIEVSRASWGLNCRGYSTLPTGEPIPAGGGILSKLQENNVLQAVGAICNGKQQCAVANSQDTFGFDPAPQCGDKQIQIEYRCYSYDRLWKLTVAGGQTAVIDCTKL